jgi:hypothetical protein
MRHLNGEARRGQSPERMISAKSFEILTIAG